MTLQIVGVSYLRSRLRSPCESPGVLMSVAPSEWNVRDAVSFGDG